MYTWGSGFRVEKDILKEEFDLHKAIQEINGAIF